MSTMIIPSVITPWKEMETLRHSIWGLLHALLHTAHCTAATQHPSPHSSCTTTAAAYGSHSPTGEEVRALRRVVAKIPTAERVAIIAPGVMDPSMWHAVPWPFPLRRSPAVARLELLMRLSSLRKQHGVDPTNESSSDILAEAAVVFDHNLGGSRHN